MFRVKDLDEAQINKRVAGFETLLCYVEHRLVFGAIQWFAAFNLVNHAARSTASCSESETGVIAKVAVQSGFALKVNRDGGWVLLTLLCALPRCSPGPGNINQQTNNQRNKSG